MNPFKLTLSFDGSSLTVDYNDGSDKECFDVTDRSRLQAIVQKAVQTALSDEAE